MKSTCLIVLALFGAIVSINAYPSVKGVPSQVSDVKGLKHPPSPGYYDRPSKVGPPRDDVKGVKQVPVVQQQHQQVQDEVKDFQQREQPVKGQVPVVPQYPVKGVRDPVKGISQHPVSQHPVAQHPVSQHPISQQPIKGQQPVGQHRQPYPIKGYPQQREEAAKGAKSLGQQPEGKGVPRQRPYYPVKGHPHQQPHQQQVQDDVQQRQQPVFPVKGQRQTRSLNDEQDFDSGKVSPVQQREQPVKGRKGGFKGVPKAPTKNIARKGGKSVEDVKVVQQESKVSDVQVKEQKVEEQVKVEQNSVKSVQESVPVVVAQEKVVQQSVPVVKVSQEKVVQESVPVVKDVQEKVVVQESVKVPQESVKVVQDEVKSVQVKEVQIKSDEGQSRSDEEVKGQQHTVVVSAIANGVGAGSNGASASASASAVVVVSREEPQVKEDIKSVIVGDVKKDDVKVVKSEEPKQARNLVGKVGSPVKGVPFYRKKISQQKDVQQNDQQVVQESQVVQQDQTVQQD